MIMHMDLLSTAAIMQAHGRIRFQRCAIKWLNSPQETVGFFFVFKIRPVCFTNVSQQLKDDNVHRQKVTYVQIKKSVAEGNEALALN